MKNLLLEIKKEVDLNLNTDALLPFHKIEDFQIKYDKILKAGFDEDYVKNIELYSKNKVKKSISFNLLSRLIGYVSTVRKQGVFYNLIVRKINYSREGESI